MKNKIIIISIMLSFFMIMIPSFSDTVKAVSIEETVDFETAEGGSAGQNFPVGGYSSIISTAQMGGYTHGESFKVSATQYYHGTKGMTLNSGAVGYSVRGLFNLSYSTSSFLTEISFFIWGSAEYSPYSQRHYISVYFFNNSLNTNCWIPTNYAFAYSYNSGTAAAGWTCGGQTMSNYGTSQAVGTWFCLNATIINDLGDVDYWSDNKGGSGVKVLKHGVMSNTSYALENIRIDRVLFVHTAGSPYYGSSISAVDWVNITLSDSYVAGGSSSCGIELADYDKLGIGNTPMTYPLNYPIFQKINYGLNYGYLAYITLYVNPIMYSADPDPNNYELTCIGFDCGGADCYELDGYNYRLIWEVGIDLGERVEGIPSGRNIDCFFTHSTIVNPSTYWQVCTGSTIDTDLDSDGNTYFKLWNSARTKIDYDVGVEFYFDPTTRYEAADSTYTDSLGLHNWVTKNTNNTYNYDINQPEGIVCSYLLSQNSQPYNNKIVVMKNTTTYYQNITNLNFPSGVIGFLPDTIGKYTFKLYNYHYIYNITAFVTGSANAYFISSNPTITNPYERYNIVYRYNHPTGVSGNIGVFNDITKRGSFVYANPTFPIAANTSTSIPYNSLSMTNEFLTLFTNLSYNVPVAYATHYIRNNNVLENNIYVSPAELGVYTGNPDGYGVEIIGSHVFTGSQVSIFINGREMFSVRDEQQFNRTFAPTNPDVYNISLRLFQNNSWITLKYCLLTVSDLGAGGEGGEITFLHLDAPYSYFAAVAIIIVTTLSPLMIIGAVKRDMRLDTIPQFLYLVMAIVGFIITIILGWFPAWSVLVLVVLAALILVIMWRSGKLQGAE